MRDFLNPGSFCRLKSIKNDFNVKSELLSHFNLIWGVQMERKKYSTSNRFGSVAISALFLPARGAYRDRHGRWCGNAMDAVAPLTNGAEADGEVVWS
jgi:hypothetical protein